MQFEPLTDLRDPAVVIAFSGWNDAGSAASDLTERLIELLPGDEMQPIDDERYFDFQATRPVLRREADGPWIQWPGIRMRRLRHETRDIVVLLGPEPNLRWRSFCAELVERVAELDPSLVMVLGAMLTDTPHSRPFPTAVYAASTGLRERFGFETSDYTGPTGIVGVLTQELAQAGLPTASLWVSVPHYVPASPNPKAHFHLLEGLEHALGVEIDHGELEQQSSEWVSAVGELAGQDPDIASYVETLEEARDQEVVEENSGDKIAAEFEQYLQRRDGE